MGIVLIFLGCFVLYSKSRYFPTYLKDLISITKNPTSRLYYIGFSLFILAIIILGFQYGFYTGTIIFLSALMLGMSMTIIFLPLNKKYAYLMAGLSILVIVIETSI